MKCVLCSEDGIHTSRIFVKIHHNQYKGCKMILVSYPLCVEHYKGFMCREEREMVRDIISTFDPEFMKFCTI